MQRSIYEDIAAEDEAEEEQLNYERVLTAETLTPRDLALWRWANMEDLDLFLRQVYEYYQNKGFSCIALTKIVHMLTVLFVVVFSSYLYSCIDYSKLYKATRLEDIRRPMCVASMGFVHKLLLWLFGVIWVLKLFQIVSTLRKAWELHEFYTHVLEIDDTEVQTVAWPAVVDRIVAAQDTNLPAHRKLDANAIVSRIMRRENYMIGLYSKNIINLEIELPVFGKTVFFTRTLEWCIDTCLNGYVFNARGGVRPVMLSTDKLELASGLKRRFQFAAWLSVLFAPFALVYTLLYFFFRYFNEYKTDPKNLGLREYTPLAEWRFRELNELPHLFRRRISCSYAPAQHYIGLFPREKTNIVIRFAVFVCSAFAAVLGALAVYDPEFLAFELFSDQSVLFYLTSLGLAITVGRSMLLNQHDQALFEPEQTLTEIVKFTHYLPDEWKGRMHSEGVKQQFTALYDMKLKNLGRELASILLNPLLLSINLVSSAENIIDYFQQFSVEGYGGFVCSLAVFEGSAEGVKARSDDLDLYYALQNGKMMQSYINFTQTYHPHANPIPAEYTGSLDQSQSFGYAGDGDEDKVQEGVLGLLNNLYRQ